MSKGLKALESLMANYYEMCQDLGNNDDQYQRCNLTSERAIIEKELKQAQKDKEMLNVFKNALTIEHHDYPMVELDHSKDAVSCFVKELTTIKQNELDKGMHKALREWVLKNAFPKEIKALNEILALHDKWLGNGMSDFEFFTLLADIKDKYDLSKEVRL